MIKYKLFLDARGQIVVAKNSPSLFSNKSLNMNKKCMVSMDVFMLRKLHYFCSRYQKATVIVRVTSYFFHKSLFGDIKLSDLERRNRKLLLMTALIIKTLFSSDNYHKTRNINTSQAAMLLVPGHNCAASTKYITYLPYYS